MPSGFTILTLPPIVVREGAPIEHALPAPSLTAPVHAVFVRPTIEKILAYRREVVARVPD